MGTFRVEGDSDSERITVMSEGMTPEELAGALRVALSRVYADTETPTTPDDLTLLNMAFTAASDAMARANRRARHYRWSLWALMIALAVNIGAALQNVGQSAGWW